MKESINNRENESIVNCQLSIIVAVAENGAIGCHNKLLWHISEDLKRFKRLTSGHPVVMGRKTFESIGRPLPNRQNIVITRNPDLRIEGVDVVGSIEEAIKLCDPNEEVFIIGGGEIYRQAMHLAQKLYLTMVYQSPEGDTFFPQINENEWTEVCREQCDGYDFIDYEANK